MYNLIKYSDIYLQTSGSLWQYYRDEPANVLNDFPNDDNNSISSKFKQQLTRHTGNNGTNDVEIMVQLKYLTNFWRALEIPLINCEISLMLTFSKICVLVGGKSRANICNN